jgi:hypothetical protein
MVSDNPFYPVSGRWLLVSGHWPLVSGYWSLVSGSWLQVSSWLPLALQYWKFGQAVSLSPLEHFRRH